MPGEYTLLLTEEEAAEFIKFLTGVEPADDSLIEMIKIQLEEQHAIH